MWMRMGLMDSRRGRRSSGIAVTVPVSHCSATNQAFSINRDSFELLCRTENVTAINRTGTISGYWFDSMYHCLLNDERNAKLFATIDFNSPSRHNQFLNRTTYYCRPVCSAHAVRLCIPSVQKRLHWEREAVVANKTFPNCLQTNCFSMPAPRK